VRHKAEIEIVAATRSHSRTAGWNSYDNFGDAVTEAESWPMPSGSSNIPAFGWTVSRVISAGMTASRRHPGANPKA